ncbi:MAG: type III secretion system export apparatus subunit SctT [Thermodesulforhabdaceae bacterium]
MTEGSDFLRFLIITAISTARMLACFTILPFLGGNILPPYIRNALVFALFTVTYPLVAPSAPAHLSYLAGFILLMKEVLVGLIIGFTVGLIFWSAEIVGFLVDNQRGSSMASALDPLYGESSSPLGVLLLQMVTALFFATGGFLVFLDGIFESYQFWPVFDFFPSLEGLSPVFFLGKVDQLMKTSFLLAAPFLIAIFIVDLALGVINRFVPQLNVFFLSMPVKSGIASFLFVLYLTVIASYYIESGEKIDHIIDLLREWIK